MFARFNSQFCFGTILLGAALLLLGASLRSVLTSRFGAVAQVQVTSNPVAYWGKETPGFILAEIRDIYSDSSLKRVVESLDRMQADQGEPRFADDSSNQARAIARLKQSMDLRPKRDTSYLDIRGWSKSPEEAARIANAIAEVHSSHVQLVAPASRPVAMSHPDHVRGFWLLACSLVLGAGGVLAFRIPVASRQPETVAAMR